MSKEIGDAISYITANGFKNGKIVSVAVFKENTYYFLENGDYVDDTPLVPVKANSSKELEDAFNKKNK
jgi:hypothetical protein